MNYYIDTNILINAMDENRPVEEETAKLLLNTPKENLYMSTLSVHIICYVLKIKPGTQLCRDFKSFLNAITLIPLTEDIIQQSMDINFPDFEDCLQYFSAVKNCDYMLTRDKRDFERIKKIWPSQIKIVSNPKDIKI